MLCIHLGILRTRKACNSIHEVQKTSFFPWVTHRVFTWVTSFTLRPIAFVLLPHNTHAFYVPVIRNAWWYGLHTQIFKREGGEARHPFPPPLDQSLHIKWLVEASQASLCVCAHQTSYRIHCAWTITWLNTLRPLQVDSLLPISRPHPFYEPDYFVHYVYSLLMVLQITWT